MEKFLVKRKVIDISTPISPFTKVFPGDPEPVIESICTLENKGCVVSRLSFGSHTGTHVDAPSHVLSNGISVDKLKLESLMGMALILDYSSLEGSITADILKKAFQCEGVSEEISILLLKTKKYSHKQKGSEDISYQNKDYSGEKIGSTYLDESAASWIVEKKFKTIGIDSFSIDSFHSKILPAHRILLSGNVNIVECLELSLVGVGIYFFLCLPLKIEDCDGAPARALLISYS
jgi:kynurenine formamidase